MFEIKKSSHHDDFEKVLFVCKARSQDKTRPFTTVLHVEHTKTYCRLIATDGRRMHVTEITAKVKSGDYQPTITKDSIIFGEPVPNVSFPNWTKVIPEKTVAKGSINLSDTGFGKNQKLTERMALEFGAFVRKTGAVVNLRFLDDLPKTEWLVCTQSEKNKAVLLKQKAEPEKTFAVVMPLNETA